MSEINLTKMGLEFSPKPEKDYKALITKALLETKRKGIKKLLTFMDEVGFFTSPCSTRFHLSVEGGLAEHSWNVYETALKLNETLKAGYSPDTIAICALLHDLGKAGEIGEQGYIPNLTKKGVQSAATPYVKNPKVFGPHAVRSVKNASSNIRLTEDESWAILCHDGLYDFMKYELIGKETPLLFILHWADIWSARVVEHKKGSEEDD